MPREVNILFLRSYFSCGNLHSVISVVWFRSKELKNVVTPVIPLSFQQSSSQIFQQSNLVSQTFRLIFFMLHGFKLKEKCLDIICLWVYAPTRLRSFTVLPKKVWKISSHLELIVLHQNFASAKVRNVAGLKIIKLQNQYLNKNVLSSS